MLLIETVLRESAIHGIGLFCVDAIPKGTKVWEFNPLFDQLVDEAALHRLPQAMHTFLKMYAYRSVETNQLYINLDLSRHMNHSDTPNLFTDAESSYFAAHDIPAGTELTCDYREFSQEGCDGFGVTLTQVEFQMQDTGRSIGS